jgi:hypothetical protein
MKDAPNFFSFQLSTTKISNFGCWKVKFLCLRSIVVYKVTSLLRNTWPKQTPPPHTHSHQNPHNNPVPLPFWNYLPFEMNWVLWIDREESKLHTILKSLELLSLISWEQEASGCHNNNKNQCKSFFFPPILFYCYYYKSILVGMKHSLGMAHLPSKDE